MGVGKRWSGAAVGIGLVAVLGGAPLASLGAMAKTRTETVYPFGPNGKLKVGLSFAGSVKGTCWTGSIAVSSSDAYRCMSNHQLIYDPCFAPPTKKVAQLACMLDPWGKLWRFELTSPIAASARHRSTKPWVWAYVLSNGTRCITDTGTGVEVDKVTLNYYCRLGGGFASLPDKSAEPWTVRYATSYRSKTLRTEPVKTAWY